MAEFFKNPDPTIKKYLLTGSVIAVVILVVTLGYLRRKEKKTQSENEKPAEVRSMALVGENLMENGTRRPELNWPKKNSQNHPPLPNKNLRRLQGNSPVTTAANNRRKKPESVKKLENPMEPTETGGIESAEFHVPQENTHDKTEKEKKIKSSSPHPPLWKGTFYREYTPPVPDSAMRNRPS